MRIAISILVMAVVAVGCQKSPQKEAYDELVGRRGVVWAPGNFLDAAKHGQTEVAVLFLQAGMNAESQDEEGKTALILAATDGHADTVTALLENGVLVDNSDNQGRTALMWATSGDHIKSVLVLIDHSADVNAKAIDGSTALSIAKKKNNEELVGVLEQAGAKD